MKALIIDHDWGKSWIGLYADSFRNKGCKVEVWDGKGDSPTNPDLVFCTWADRDFTRMFPAAKHAMMMRRFEFFHSNWRNYDWSKIDLLVCCNPWIAAMVNEEIKCDATTIVFVRNSIDASKWTVSNEVEGHKIGMTCRVFPVKNLPLAAQIILRLPKEYTLHIAGPIQDPNIYHYMLNTLGDRVKFYGELKREHLDEWWNDKICCLSTSISEGDPMGVMEAMAKGIKPVVHNWHGASELYDKTFNTVEEAGYQIVNGNYRSINYRNDVEKNNSISNIEFVTRLLVLRDVNHV